MISYNALGPEYNYRIGNVADLDLRIPFEDLIVIHYTSAKPWSLENEKRHAVEFVNAWWSFIRLNREYFYSNRLVKIWLLILIFLRRAHRVLRFLD